MQTRAETPLPWRGFRRYRSVAARHGRIGLFPLIHAVTKADRAAAWILEAVCGYRATKLWFSAFLATYVKRTSAIFSSDDKLAREQGSTFEPRFDSAGLLSAVVQDSVTGEVLMVAFMDREALEATRRTGFAHFHSRSRGRLWKKGESSGHVLQVDAILVDCDQDALVIRARPAGPACHTGARTCFYRALEGERLSRIEA